MEFRLSTGDKSHAQPTQPQDNSKNTQTGGGYYNPQIQGGIKVNGGGKINLGPEIKGGGSFTINKSSEKQTPSE